MRTSRRPFAPYVMTIADEVDAQQSMESYMRAMRNPTAALQLPRMKCGCVEMSKRLKGQPLDYCH
jgi:hypothetical protein